MKYPESLAIAFAKKCKYSLKNPGCENIVVSSEIVHHPNRADLLNLFCFCTCRIMLHNSILVIDSLSPFDYRQVIARIPFSIYFIEFSEFYNGGWYYMVLGYRDLSPFTFV
ncbi:unnamed protein product [Hydatigera taeniaeformis]|uniref:Methyltranfer_dom domain-containing protein n=1 Tax=Hydatigena taeniaeformis TaxID=6205 RepID=A0A0R3X784_HYDTA|nr:unnamed protein product [Hydatigera taeniaeformis]